MTGSDGGFSCYRIVMQTLMNREGGVMDIVEQVMKRAGVTPAHAWLHLREENRVGVLHLEGIDETDTGA